MRLLLALFVVVALGCGHAEPDPLLLGELRRAVTATADAMRVAPADRPTERALTDQLNLLAYQSAPERVADIRAGAYGAVEMKKDVNELIFELGKRQPPMRAPLLFTYLAQHVDELTIEQRLLLNALSRQLEREARLR